MNPAEGRRRITSTASGKTSEAGRISWDDREYYAASDYYDKLYELPRSSSAAEGLADDLTHEQMKIAATTPASRAVPPSADRTPKRTSTSSAAEGGESMGRRNRDAQEDRSFKSEHEHARPGDLPHQEGAPPPHGRQVASIRCTISRTRLRLD